jgi:type II secretory pathway component PulJ
MLFAVVYGCTPTVRDYIGSWFKYARASAFDPLLLPMTFAELERRRLIDMVEAKGGDLGRRIIDMENRLRQDGPRKSTQSGDSEKESITQGITQRECEAVNLWVQVSSLRNGLESLRTELASMLQNSKEPLENGILTEQADKQPDQSRKISSGSIQGRLCDMIVEINSIVRRTSNILGGMSLATQTVSLPPSPAPNWQSL